MNKPATTTGAAGPVLSTAPAAKPKIDEADHKSAPAHPQPPPLTISI